MATIQELTMQADRGNAEAMVQLAGCYANGKNGVSWDSNMALYWYEKAAAKDKRYRVDLGVFLTTLPENDNRAEGRAILKEMAHDGYVSAFVPMARCCLSDSDQVYWFAKAAVNGVAEGYFRLGYHFENGKGVAKDLKCAMASFYRAAQQGHHQAPADLSRFYHDGLCCPPDYSKAAAYAQQAVDRKSAYGLTRLGVCRYYGHGVPEDKNEAFRLFYKAVGDNYFAGGEGHYFVGLCYLYGHGVSINTETAYTYFDGAAYRYTPAMYMKGCIHMYYHAKRRDEKEAVQCFQRAADQGYAPAMAAIGNFHLYGTKGMSKDYRTALRYLQPAAEEGIKEAQRDLSACYSNGWGVSRDLEKMRYWSECSNGLRTHSRYIPPFDPASIDPLAKVLKPEDRRSELDKAAANLFRPTPPKTVTKTVTTTTTYYGPGQAPKTTVTTTIGPAPAPKPAPAPAPKPAPAPAPKPTPAPAPKPKEVTAEDRKQAAALALQGLEKYRQSQFGDAFKLGSQALELDPKCTKGNLLVGWMYHFGLHVKEDKRKAIDYFYAPVETDPQLFNIIGCYHYHGWGGKPVNKREALWNFMFAASKDHLNAMCNAANCFAEGISLNPKDSRRKTNKYFYEYLEKAAGKGSMRACSMLMMEHLMDRSPRLLNKYEKMHGQAKKQTAYQGVIEAEKRAIHNQDRISMGLLFE